MGYVESIDWVMGLTDYEKTGFSPSSQRWDLRRMEELMQRLGNPQKEARSIHVAGTKGKGSISALIASALSYCGYSVGLYTSPHLHTIRERIRLNNGLISPEDFTSVARKVKPLVEEMNKLKKYGEITTFEALTAMAFLYFQSKKVQFQVLEVGLGGRLDATNVVQPDVSVISAISYDHTEVLGNTLREISLEKGGIIKKGSVVVLSPQSFQVKESGSVVEDVVARLCQEKGVKLVKVKEGFKWTKLDQDLGGQYLVFNSQKGSYNIFLPLLGAHQRENAATALAALEALELDKPGLMECSGRGFAQVSWPGRLQALQKEPLLLADGAHNEDSLLRVRESLDDSFPTYRPACLIFGASRDKDIAGMARAIAPVFPEILLVRSQHPRSAPLAYLQKIFSEAGFEAKTALSMGQALDEAMPSAEKDDLILVTGSLFAVAEAIEHLGLTPPGYDY